MSFKITKNFKQSLKYLYKNFVPEYLKVKLSNLIDPLPKNRMRSSTSVRIENYFQAYNKELKMINNDDRSNQYLHKAFKKHLVRSDLINNNWWSDFIILSNLPEGPEFQKINQSLIGRIEYSNFNSLEHFELLDIYGLCLRLSLFDLGYHLRQKAIEIALNYPPSSKKNESWKFKAKLSALLETSNFCEFDKLLPLFNSKIKHEKYFLIYLRNILEGNYGLSDEPLASDINSDRDLKFRKFIENKKIIVVSPKKVLEKDGDKIDNADIVVRSNYKIGDFINKGSRTDISYFNRLTSEDINKNGCFEWPSDMKWSVGRAWDYMETILKRLSSDGLNIDDLNVRTITRIDDALFYGLLFTLPNIVVDLIRYKPKEIFLYHFDLLLSKDRIPGYFKNVNNNKELDLFLVNTFSVHDPVINFLIIKLFWKKGFIKGDQYLEEVMKMEINEYMISLQKIYRTVNSLKVD
jgi:hypothetical protein